MDMYDHTSIEEKWQSFWADNRLFRASKDKQGKKYYCLTMYPYPSGTLHIGHVLNYTIGDALVRYHIMKGDNVFSPMGWDSFGLPAENAAIREQIEPARYTAENLKKMKAQMIRAGWGYDWEREIATSHPGYYTWTQWIFLQLFKNGLAFKKKASVNWCPSCETVLANEQVRNERCERCNSEIEQKQLSQWFFKMSKYAQRLLDNHKLLRGKWPERVLKMQEEWIGRSEGSTIDFTLKETGEKLPIFTTRPDTLFGVTFMAVSPHHVKIREWLMGTPREQEVMEEVRKLRKQGVSVRNIQDIEKIGIDTGLTVINPVNGDEISLWVANFVLMEYGTGVIMAVPAHDQRDFEFARQYNIPIKVVIQPENSELDPASMEEAFVDDGVMVNSDEFNGMKNTEAMGAITEKLQNQGCARKEVNYRLKDWLISRQRYWGAPIPVIHCDTCGTVPVPDEDLPVMLPDHVEFKPTGESPLAECGEFLYTTCPECGGEALRETDTMDTFVDSSWYFMRYLNPRLEDKPFEKEDSDFWMPVDQYVGGIEHATMHLVYFRFLMLVFYDLGLVSFREPAENLFCQGMVCKTAHYCDSCKWVAEEDVDLEKGICRKCGSPVHSEMAKISKTKLNTVSPDEIMDEYGADAMRLNILSDNPPDQEQIWSEESVRGSHRFLKRLFTLVHEDIHNITDPEAYEHHDPPTENEEAILTKMHQTIMKVTDCIESNMHFNTAIASVNELVNLFRSMEDISPHTARMIYKTILLLLAPVTPHICEELWQTIGEKESIFLHEWPEADIEMAAEDTVEIAIQVNGKVRSRIEVNVAAGEEEIEQTALQDSRVKEFLSGREIRKTIIIPSRLINIVV